MGGSELFGNTDEQTALDPLKQALGESDPRVSALALELLEELKEEIP